jgi:hypothetical protein
MLVWVGIAPYIRNNKLVINSARESNAKESIRCMSKNPEKLWLAPPEGKSWAYNLLVISSDFSSKIVMVGRGY